MRARARTREKVREAKKGRGRGTEGGRGRNGPDHISCVPKENNYALKNTKANLEDTSADFPVKGCERVIVKQWRQGTRHASKDT